MGSTSDGILSLRDAMKACDEAYTRYAGARDSRNEKATARAYNEWRMNFGALDLAVAQVDEVLEIFGPDARSTVAIFLASEAEPAPEDGLSVATAAVQSGEGVPSDLQGTTAEIDFPQAQAALDAFIAKVYKPSDIAAARARLKGAMLARG
jgi:hypothetical protein